MLLLLPLVVSIAKGLPYPPFYPLGRPEHIEVHQPFPPGQVDVDVVTEVEGEPSQELAASPYSNRSHTR